MAEVWLGGDAHADHFSDVTDLVERKLDAIRCHASQLPMVDQLETTVRSWLGDTARRGGLPEGRLAEAFRVVATL